MAKYQQYDEYKDSGVEWLGEIPKDWKAIKVKYIADTVSTGGTPKDLSSFTLEPEVCWFTPGDFHDGQILRQANKYVTWKSVNTNDAKIYKENSVLVIGIGATLGKVAHCSIPFSCNQQINVITPNSNISSFFLMYSLLVQDEQMSLSSNASTIGIMNQEKTKDILLALPSLKEQKTVTNFLDYQTAQIDTLIDKQQTLIQLLKEKRQAVISHAVTKGLNPDAPMKDSGVEWLGNVPEHWELTKIKYIAELTPSKAKILPSLEKRCSFVPMEKLKLDTLILDETRKIKDVYQGYTYFEDDDVLIAKVTPCFENQNMAIAANLVNGIGFGSSEIYVLRTEAEGLNQFLLYRLQESVFMQLGAGAMTGAGGLRRVPSDFINDFQFALPPINEQQEIVAYIEKMKNTFNDLVYKAEQAIQLMQERRTALISAAVTGKIDVRGWVAPE